MKKNIVTFFLAACLATTLVVPFTCSAAEENTTTEVATDTDIIKPSTEGTPIVEEPTVETPTVEETTIVEEEEVIDDVDEGYIYYEVDDKKPTIKGVSNGKTYKKTVTIKFSDKSGIKKATLNGKSIKSGKKVSKSGKYTLKVTDKANNTKTVKFKIKK